jgi:hypothetical protein
MSTGNYPNEFLTIFNSANFNATNGSDVLTKEQADLLYLKYPFGQGNESIPSLIVAENASVGENLSVAQNLQVTGNIFMRGTDGINYLQFPDGTQQFTASTGGGSGNVNIIYSSSSIQALPLISGSSVSPYGSVIPTIPTGLCQVSVSYKFLNTSLTNSITLTYITNTIPYNPISGTPSLVYDTQTLLFTPITLVSGDSISFSFSQTINRTNALALQIFVLPTFTGSGSLILQANSITITTIS